MSKDKAKRFIRDEDGNVVATITEEPVPDYIQKQIDEDMSKSRDMMNLFENLDLWCMAVMEKVKYPETREALMDISEWARSYGEDTLKINRKS